MIATPLLTFQPQVGNIRACPEVQPPSAIPAPDIRFTNIFSTGGCIFFISVKIYTPGQETCKTALTVSHSGAQDAWKWTATRFEELMADLYSVSLETSFSAIFFYLCITSLKAPIRFRGASPNQGKSFKEQKCNPM